MNRFRDDWIVTRRAAKFFLVSTILVVVLTVLLGPLQTAKVTPLIRILGGILGITGALGTIFLWLGMWRYWSRIDNSNAWLKRFWFLVLLVGFWWGSCLYCWFAYLPQVFRGRIDSTRLPSIAEKKQDLKAFRYGLILGWVLFFLAFLLRAALPNTMGWLGVAFFTLSMLLLVFGLFAYCIACIYRAGMARR